MDAGGLVLAPGFIDMHAHSDLALLAEPDHLAKVSQGVTCEVLGQDGLSYAPVDDVTLDRLRRQLAGWNGDPEGKEQVPRWIRAMLPGVKPSKSEASQPEVELFGSPGGSIRSTFCTGAVTSPAPE